MNEKMKALLSSEEFAGKAKECKTAEELAMLFNENGVEITAEELKALAEKIMASAEGELSDDALEDVSGGVWQILAPILVSAAFTGVEKLYERKEESFKKAQEKIRQDQKQYVDIPGMEYPDF